jgi:4-hydroxybenzoate polyprenyltransferase
VSGTGRALAALTTWGRLVKLSHTFFALPFALSAAALATASRGFSGERWLWILVAMFAARNAAMSFNRLVDQWIDERNPRTADRELPAGRIERRTVWLLTAALVLFFIVAASRLDLLGFAWIALPVLLGYSFTKRLTWASHLVLGLALGLAPLGAWLAVAGSLAATPLLLASAVTCWVGGFDLIYACQDVESDRRQRLHSFPARFGRSNALRAARWLHVLMAVLLGVVGVQAGLHPIYWLGWAAVCGILVLEHRAVTPGDLSRLDIAFFRLNAAVSVVYFAAVLAALAAARLSVS